MDSLSPATTAAVMQQISEVSASTLPEMKKDAGTAPAKDTSTISKTGLQVASAPRQPTQEELRENALTAEEMEELLGESLSTALGGLLNNGNFMSGVSESGIQVDVERHTEASEKQPLKSGEQDASVVLGYSASITTSSGKLDITFNDSVFIQEMEDGRTSVYYKESDTTRYYAADGSYTEEAGNLLKNDAESIIINISGDIHTENGNNLIFNWADNVNISTGNGNDTVILAEQAKGVNISTGAGDDKVIGGQIENSKINLGGGNNELCLNKATGSSIAVGSGNTTITHNSLLTGKTMVDGWTQKEDFASSSSDQPRFFYFSMDNSTLSMGKGAHDVRIGSAENGSSIKLESYKPDDSYSGREANIRIGSLVNSSFLADGYGYNLMLGEMVNSMLETTGKGAAVNISARRVEDSVINMDSQSATLRIDLFTGDSSLTTGEGGYGLIFGEISGNADINIAGGHTYLKAESLKGNARLNIGGGISLNASFGELSGNAVFTLGSHYSTSLSIGALLGNAATQMGHGDKTVLVGSMGDNASLDAGTGSALVGIGALGGNASINGGKAVVAQNQGGRLSENIVDLGAMPLGEEQAAKKDFWEGLTAAHRVLPSIDKEILNLFKPNGLSE